MIKNKATGMRVSVIALFVILNVVVCASARVFPSPSWSGEPGTTFQQWSFEEWNYGPVNPDDGWNSNAQLYVNPNSLWNANIDGHPGVWTFTGLWGGVGISIPNNSVPQPENEMWIELTWKAANLSIVVPDRPLIGVGIQPDQEILIDGWMSSLFKIDFGSNLPDEWITINGDILLDQVVIDTYSGVPEPATLVLAIGGAIMAFRRKRKV